MTEPSSVPRLTDIIEAIELIRNEMSHVTLDAFEPDRRKRWLVERGIEIISEASRRLPALLTAFWVRVGKCRFWIRVCHCFAARR
jgi:uncharacterized protein with HEPN domain